MFSKIPRSINPSWCSQKYERDFTLHFAQEYVTSCWSLQINFITTIGYTTNLFTFSTEQKYENEHSSGFRLSIEETDNGSLASVCEYEYEQLYKVSKLISVHIKTLTDLNSKSNKRLCFDSE